MNKLALSTLALGLTLAAPSAFAQQACPPGSWLCADITIGGGVQAPPPVYVSPPVMVMPPPPVVYMQPRPRVYIQPPPPARVYIQPPPVVVYQPQQVYVPQQQFYYQQQQPQQGYQLQPPPRRGYAGLQVGLGGSYLGSGSMHGAPGGMGGVSGGLRLRGAGHLGGELTIGIYGGRDFNRDDRTEVPISLSGLVYFNPQNRFQIYGVFGVGASWASVNYAAGNTAAHGGLSGANYGYVGGQLGLGAELQLSQRFSLFVDVRGFVRTRVDDGRNRNPEFSQFNASLHATETTNTSFGAVGQIGAALYF